MRKGRGDINCAWKATFSFYTVEFWAQPGSRNLQGLKPLFFYFDLSTPIDAPLWVVMNESLIISLATSV